MTTYPLFLCLSIAIQSTPTSDANIATSHLNEACKQTFDADLCLKILSVYPESQTFNFHGLASLAASAAANTSSYISGLLNGEKIEDEDFQQCLYDCKRASWMHSTRMAMEKDAFEDANLWVMAAKRDGQVRDERCKNLSDMKVLLESAEFSKLCSIVLNMASVLTTSH